MRILGPLAPQDVSHEHYPQRAGGQRQHEQPAGQRRSLKIVDFAAPARQPLAMMGISGELSAHLARKARSVLDFWPDGLLLPIIWPINSMPQLPPPCGFFGKRRIRGVTRSILGRDRPGGGGDGIRTHDTGLTV
jgi:hypothetical protein